MKSSFLNLLAILAVSTTIAQSKGQQITVTIDNVTSNDGHVLFALHDSKTFMASDGVDATMSAIKDGKVSVTFTNVQPGVYAILALHDANDNGRMDFQSNGMPQEAYGMSNNPMSYGPPQFNDGKFAVTDKDIDLKIRF